MVVYAKSAQNSIGYGWRTEAECSTCYVEVVIVQSGIQNNVSLTKPILQSVSDVNHRSSQVFHAEQARWSHPKLGHTAVPCRKGLSVYPAVSTRTTNS
jgi:hypothetical protein